MITPGAVVTLDVCPDFGANEASIPSNPFAKE